MFPFCPSLAIVSQKHPVGCGDDRVWHFDGHSLMAFSSHFVSRGSRDHRLASDSVLSYKTKAHALTASIAGSLSADSPAHAMGRQQMTGGLNTSGKQPSSSLATHGQMGDAQHPPVLLTAGMRPELRRYLHFGHAMPLHGGLTRGCDHVRHPQNHIDSAMRASACYTEMDPFSNNL
jgi:hypothetical protein